MSLRDWLRNRLNPQPGPTPMPDPTNPDPSPTPALSIRDRLRQRAIDAAKKYGPWLASAAIGAIIAYLTGVPFVPPPLPQAAPGLGDTPPPNAFGWVRDDEQVKAAKSLMPRPVFAETPAGQQADPLPDHVYLWDGHRKLRGEPPPAHDQNPIGSCVSFGTARALEHSFACEIAFGGAPFEFASIAEEVIYAGSRVEIGGGRIRGDGSVGAWAARFVTTYGGLPRGTFGRYDLMGYDPSRCRQWGYSGVPDDLEPDVKRYPVGDASQVNNWTEAKRALANRCGIAICSDQGFTRQRDANGVCRASGNWMHCMALTGYHQQDGKEWGHIENSWGPDYHVGPVGWGNPNTAGFWADAAVIDRMLRQGDSWAFSAVKGFPARALNWEVRVPHRQNKADAVFALAW